VKDLKHIIHALRYYVGRLYDLRRRYRRGKSISGQVTQGITSATYAHAVCYEKGG
jgi:hypothetical protein